MPSKTLFQSLKIITHMLDMRFVRPLKYPILCVLWAQ